MRRTSRYFFIGMTLAIVYALIFFSVSFLINAGSNQLSTIYVPQVKGQPSFSNPGQEAFWNTVQAHVVPLIEANSYPGSPAGGTSTVTVKMAWENVTGTAQLLVLMTFANAGSSANWVGNQPVPIVNNTSYNNVGHYTKMYANSTCTNPSSSCYGGFYPQDVGFLPLAIGSSYIYPEQAIVMLGMAPGAGTDTWYAVSYKPKMVLGTSGALGTGTGGAAELWVWSSGSTDNSSQDTNYPGLKLPNGTNLDPSMYGMPKHASYAVDGYSNASSFYQLGGLPNSSPYPYQNVAALETSNTSILNSTSVAPSDTWNPFEVQAKGNYNTGNSWTVEFMRPLSTPKALGENNLQLQMDPTSPYNYHVAFAVSQGQLSQTYLIYYNSVSFWWSFNFVNPSGFNEPATNPANSFAAPLSSIMVAMFLLAFVGSKTAFAPTKKNGVSISSGYHLTSL
ncbi:MAG: DOMON domain-containing protein [Nitrososphaerales archaeon]